MWAGCIPSSVPAAMPSISIFFDASCRNHLQRSVGLFAITFSVIVTARRQYIMIKPGRYRHYKGGEYEVLGIAKHSETEEDFVVYRQLYGAGSLWIRPKAMFTEAVIIEGRTMPRFEFLEEPPV